MEKLTKSEQGDMNALKEENDGKIVEKQAVIVEEAENAPSASGSGDLIADEIDEAKSVIQAKAVKAAAKSIENTTDNSGNVKPSNLEIEAAASTRNDEELSISPIDDHASLTECQSAAYSAEQTYNDAQEIVIACNDLMEKISSTIEVLQSSIYSFNATANEAFELNTNYDHRKAAFYRTVASEYELSKIDLQNRAKRLRKALNRVEEYVTEYSRYAALADESLDESASSKSSAGRLTNEGVAAIIFAVKKERAAFLTMRKIWSSVIEDVKFVDPESISVDDSDVAAQCENRDRKAAIAHFVVGLLGLSLIYLTTYFQVGSDSFIGMLTLTIIINGWCGVYWIHKFYTCIKSRCCSKDNEETAIGAEMSNLRKYEYIDDCDMKLETVKSYFRKYNVRVESDDSDTGGSSETVRADEVPQ